MNKEEKLAMLQSLSEEDLTKRFLIPLYESMGCKNVHYNHGVLEFGKDIIYYREDEFENRVYSGVQVKKDKVTVRSNDKLLRQILEAFGAKFRDDSDGTEKDLNRFIVLTSKEFTKNAENSLWAALRRTNLDKLITLIDGSKLVKLLDEKYPSAFYTEYTSPDKYYDSILKKFREMLTNLNSSVNDFKQLFLENPWLVWVGYKYANIILEEGTSEYNVDFSLETFEHDYDIMILKHPRDPIILDSIGGWGLSEECQIAISQIYRYFEWYAQEAEKHHYKPETDYKPNGFIIVGQYTERENQRKLRLINQHFHRIQISTYDSLYEQAKRWIEFKTREGK